jgi:hypothetical protein
MHPEQIREILSQQDEDLDRLIDAICQSEHKAIRMALGPGISGNIGFYTPLLTALKPIKERIDLRKKLICAL